MAETEKLKVVLELDGDKYESEVVQASKATQQLEKAVRSFHKLLGDHSKRIDAYAKRLSTANAEQVKFAKNITSMNRRMDSFGTKAKTIGDGLRDVSSASRSANANLRNTHTALGNIIGLQSVRALRDLANLLDRVTRRVNSIGQTEIKVNVGNSSRNLQRLANDMRHLRMEAAGTRAVLRDLSVGLSSVRGAVHNVWEATGGWILRIIEQKAEIERLTKVMSGLSDETGRYAREAEAAKDVDFLLTLAENAPFKINSLTRSLVKMRAGGIEDTTFAMRSLTNAVAAFGGTDEMLERAAIAIQQMGGKGVVSMEEMRQQMGEAVPSALRMMARGMGMSMRDLVKAISEGKVEAAGAMKRMFLEFELSFGGSAANMMDTWNGMTRRLSVAWTKLLLQVNDAGLFDEAKVQLNDLINYLRSDQAMRMAQQLGAGLASAIRGARQAAGWLANNLETIENVSKTILMLWAGSRIVGIIQDVVSVSGLMRTGLLAAGRAGISVFSKAGLTGWMLRLVGGASGVGLLVTAITLVYQLAKRFNMLKGSAKSAMDEARAGLAEFINTGGKSATYQPEQLANAEHRIELLKQMKGKLETFLAMAKISSETGVGVITEDASRIAQRIMKSLGARDAVEALRMVDTELNSLNSAFEQGMADRVRRVEELAQTVAGEQVSKIIIEATEKTAKLEKAIEEKRTELNEAQGSRKEALNQQINEMRAEMVRMRFAFTEQALNQIIKDGEASLSTAEGERAMQLQAAVNAAKNELTKERRLYNDAMESILDPGGIIEPDKSDRVEKLFTRLEKQIAKSKAKLEETSPIVESFKIDFENLMEGFDEATRKEYEARFGPLIKVLEDLFSLNMETKNSPIAKFLEDIQDIGTAIENSVVKWAQASEDAIVSFTKTGKFSFSDFANSIMEDMLRIAIRQSMIQPLMQAVQSTNWVDAAAGWVGSVFPGADPSIAAASSSKSMGGPSINVINQTGQPVAMKASTQPRFDGEKFVMDVVMKNINQPGAFRDNMQSGMSR